ncbi:MAG TPA: hypothetical protein VE422_18390 [Terriglobia bacterium]|nr:hypothetical protein [Terriglobia bacterium]
MAILDDGPRGISNDGVATSLQRHQERGLAGSGTTGHHYSRHTQMPPCVLATLGSTLITCSCSDVPHLLVAGAYSAENCRDANYFKALLAEPVALSSQLLSFKN